eukprot:CAMPEP_0174912072 /NCGR_PEP_ID=MMETSP0167-20121228/79594_1 /TAXON_ID=38298 /ORGANISM="Rhodella maculata, Strain CCMP736" /LENGTH=72 /DNA_ID=CAMNT_0016156711 /DNA_START=89 /DNA_END=307 /DNA_ORIENTATION=-
MACHRRRPLIISKGFIQELDLIEVCEAAEGIRGDLLEAGDEGRDRSSGIEESEHRQQKSLAQVDFKNESPGH